MSLIWIDGDGDPWVRGKDSNWVICQIDRLTFAWSRADAEEAAESRNGPWSVAMTAFDKLWGSR